MKEMRVTFPLYLQTVCLLFLYLILLGTVSFLAFNAQFGLGWDALLKSPFGDRIDTIGDAICSKLQSGSPSVWNEILNRYGDTYHVKFYLFSAGKEQLAGAPVELPDSVTQAMHRPHLPPPLFVGAGPSGFMHGPFIRSGPPELSGPQGALGPRGLEGPPGPRGLEEPPLPGPQAVMIGPSGASATVIDSPFLHHDLVLTTGAYHHLMWTGTGTPEHSMAAFIGRPMMHFPLHPLGKFIVHSKNPDTFWFGIQFLLMDRNAGRPVPACLVASTDNIWTCSLLVDFKFFGIVAAGILAASLVFWWPFVYQITSSLSQLCTLTDKISQGRFQERFITKRTDEIGKLAQCVNLLAAQLDRFVCGQKRFLADISHELNTPIARLQMELACLDGQMTAEQQEVIVAMQEEIREMTNLVQELLAFSRAEFASNDIELSSVNLKAVVDEVIQRLNVNATTLQTDVPENLNVLGDRTLLARSISNILRNSVRYAGQYGPITVSAKQSGNTVTAIFADNGPGVPTEALQHLGEPFYRPERSRSRDSGGVGLGLAIVKSCVEACNGILSLRNRKPSGFEVEMQLKSQDGELSTTPS